MICLSRHLILAMMKSLPDFILECSIMYKLYYKVHRRKKIIVCSKIKEAIL